ncbi:MAG: Uma2 family endonuclease [Chloroflexota bacterium]|nr:Uma2 family endonuclease [Chloroflexota bacterium]
MEGRQALHDGVVVEMPPPGPGRGALPSRLTRRLGNWCEAQGLPEPLGDVPCRLAPRRVVGAELAVPWSSLGSSAGPAVEETDGAPTPKAVAPEQRPWWRRAWRLVAGD